MADEEAASTARQSQLAEARAAGMAPALLDRLSLDPKRLAAMAEGCEAVAALPDPLGETFDMRRLANGLQVGKRRVPIGVLGGFTTFSSYAFESFQLIRDAQYLRASVNVAGQVVLGLASFWLGYLANRML